MKQILFVDDEPQILEGLQNLLRRHRRKWDMAFALGGEAALKELEGRRFDVIVSDMRMPGLDGATLLGRVQEQYPGTARIVLSGHTELEATMRAVPVAHQFLSKPCDADTLENVVERACNLQALIGDEVVRRIIGKIEKLPSLPHVYAALTKALVDEETTAADVAGILEQDMAICAKLLQLVNSAFFRIARRIASIEDAVVYLGSNMVKNLVLAVEVFRPADEHSKLKGFSFESLQQHALYTASIAAQIATDKQQAEDAFMAGMLHDIGKLILACEFPEYLQQVVATASKDNRPMYVVEQDSKGVTHAEIGAYLLGLWGLPYPIIEAVANHHCPTRVQQRGFDALAAVYVANLLVHESVASASGKGNGIYDEVDLAYLETLGVADRLESWRTIATEQTQS